MAADNTYNGWTNYETWNVNLWLDNDGSDFEEMAQECMQEAIDSDESDIRASATHALSKRIEEYVDEMQEAQGIQTSGMFADLLSAALRAVDYYSIAGHHIDGITLYSAGSNMPGYLPNTAPSMFIDADDAVENVRDLMRDDSDGMGWSDSDIELIDDIKADSKGEYGATLYNKHYFVSIV